MTSGVQAAIERTWRRIEPLALYPRSVDVARVRVLSTPWLFRLPWFRRFDGYTIWSTILLRGPIERLDDELLTHELVHVWQGQHEWLRLWASYVKPSTFWGDRSGYWGNRYEREARAAVANTGAAAARPAVRHNPDDQGTDDNCPHLTRHRPLPTSAPPPSGS
jgi:hypothetical protein